MAPSDPHWCKPRLLCQHAPARSWLYGCKNCQPKTLRLSATARVWPLGFAGLQMGLFTWVTPACSGGQLPEARLAEQALLILNRATALLSRGWLAPRAGCSPSQAAGARVPAHVSSRLLPSDAVWDGVALSAAVTPAKHCQWLHKRWGG